MPHLKRFFWLLAWCVWLWLGVGLYRELPRDLGPELCKLPIGKGDTILGFVKDTPKLAVQERGRTSLKIKKFDARSGALEEPVRETNWQPRPPSADAITQGVFLNESSAVIVSAPGEPPRRKYSFDVLDLSTGEWHGVSNRSVDNVTVHPTKSWVAFSEFGNTARELTRSLVVVDWPTGAELFERPPTPERTEFGKPIFLGDSDRMVIPTWREAQRSNDKPTDLEIWKIGPEPRLEKVVRAPWFGESPHGSSSGRLTWTRPGTKGDFDVFDLNAERMLRSIPPPEERERSVGRVFYKPARLSRNGRGVLGGIPERLWNVETGALIWEPSPFETFTYGQEGRRVENAFAVMEEWRFPWPVPARFRWMTFASRSLDDGSLNWRCWDRDYTNLQYCSADGTLAVNSTGVVHRLPLRVNYTLLALCQSILALPLILLWAVLRWQRKRRLRMAIATP